MSEPFFHELAFDNFAQASVFARLRTLVRAERVYLGEAPLIAQYSLHLMRQFRDGVRVDCPSFDVREMSALGANLYYGLRSAMTLDSLLHALQQVQDCETHQREMALLTEWIESLLEPAMERCGWTPQHQAQLSGLKETIQRSMLIDFMQRLTDCTGTVPPEKLARITMAMLSLLKDGGTSVDSITIEQVHRVLSDE